MNTQKIFVVLVFLFTIALTLSSNTEAASNTMEVHFIDVWQGDAAIIVSPEGWTLLIDAGGNSYGDEVLAFMESQNITHIDYMLSSHYHADHIGGSDTVIYFMPVDYIFDRGGTLRGSLHVRTAGDMTVDRFRDNAWKLLAGIRFRAVSETPAEASATDTP